MTLLIIVAALAFEALTAWPEKLRDYTWFEKYLRWLRGRVGAGAILPLLLALAPPVLATLLLQALFAEPLGGLAGVLLAWGLLLYCFGPFDLLSAANAYLRAGEERDTARADELAERMTGRGDDREPRAVAHALLAHAHDGYYAVLFWFIVLGPVGAVLYAFCRHVYQRAEDTSHLHAGAAHLLGIMGWIPTRLTALGFALMGNFDQALFRLGGGPTPQPHLAAANQALLSAVGSAALSAERHEDDDLALVSDARSLALRTLTLWLVALALLTLGGWFS